MASLMLLMTISACGGPQDPAANQVNRLLVGDYKIDRILKEITHHEQDRNGLV
ncbi:hypothetical protein ABES58_11500 [Paenibacillus lautus]|uniref:hypothetical protein n=1 Tax=Paenibacillus lautus TaxID=1401 RepID=UPI003D2A938F